MDKIANDRNWPHTLGKLFALLVALGGVGFVLYRMELFQLFMNKERLIAFLDALGAWSFAGFILLQAFQVVAAPIPGEVSGLIGGFLFGPFVGVILSTIGLTIGSYVAFALSRVYGRPFVERVVSKASIERFDYLLQHRGPFLIFLLFLIPGIPKDYLCYILGLGHLSTAEFMVIGASGRLLGTILLTLGGNFIRLEQYTRFFILVAVALLVVVAVLVYKDRIERLFRHWHHKTHRHPES